MNRRKPFNPSKPGVVGSTQRYTAVPPHSTPCHPEPSLFSWKHGWGKVAVLTALLIVLLPTLVLLAYVSYAAIVDPGWQEGPLAKPLVHFVRTVRYKK